MANHSMGADPFTGNAISTKQARQQIHQITHPDYLHSRDSWYKWRLCYLGGFRFLDVYLQKLSSRESDYDFKLRKAISYVPAFAKSAIDEIKNSIFQRMVDVIRMGGDPTYQSAIRGDMKGVDLVGSTMTNYIGRKILPELLTMGKVGVYVDMPEISVDATALEAKDKHPYLYYYEVENIQSWTFDESDRPYMYQALLLRDYVYNYDNNYGLPIALTQRYRHYYKADNTVFVQFYNENGDPTDRNGIPNNEPYDLKIAEIPFVVLQLSNSLLADIADYQLALMNLASADMTYAMKSNFPFYTEQFDPKAFSPFIRSDNLGTPPKSNIGQPFVGFDQTVPPTTYPGGSAQAGNQSLGKEIVVGSNSGRGYPLGTERPAFINPSSEPLRVSMEKQEMLKREIKQLLLLAVTSLTPTKMASADTKSMDLQGLEAGLSYIGLELEYAERRIAEFWSMYTRSDKGSVHYPTSYTLRSDQDRRTEAKEIRDLMEAVPSTIYRKEMAKRIVDITLGSKLDLNVLNEMYSQIDNASAIVSSPDAIAKDVELGLVSNDTASQLRGYPKGEPEKAAKDHEDRLRRIAIAQSPGGGAARGVADLGSPTDGKEEKAASRDTTTDGVVKDKVRGTEK